jgi:hypothetical protein
MEDIMYRVIIEPYPRRNQYKAVVVNTDTGTNTHQFHNTMEGALEYAAIQIKLWSIENGSNIHTVQAIKRTAR